MYLASLPRRCLLQYRNGTTSGRRLSGDLMPVLLGIWNTCKYALRGLVAGSALQWCAPCPWVKQGNDIDLVADAPDIIIERYYLGNVG